MIIVLHPAHEGRRPETVHRWGRCGACGRGFCNHALGTPRFTVQPHYGGLPLMAGRGPDERGRKPAGSGWPDGPCPGPEARLRGAKRRGGALRSAASQRLRRHTPQGVVWLDAPRGAPPPSHVGGTRNEGVPGAFQRIRAIRLGCLTIESDVATRGRQSHYPSPLVGEGGECGA